MQFVSNGVVNLCKVSLNVNILVLIYILLKFFKFYYSVLVETDYTNDGIIESMQFRIKYS